MNNFHEWLSKKQTLIESLLEKNLPELSPESDLNEAIRYSILNGGKRIRSTLVFAIAEIVEVDPIAIEKIVCAIEFLHAYSLVHDDIMDDAPLRRGNETVHEKWNINAAILSGDGMMIQSYALLQKNANNNFALLFELFFETLTAFSALFFTGFETAFVVFLRTCTAESLDLLWISINFGSDNAFAPIPCRTTVPPARYPKVS